jgi:hypothetical protein
MLSTILAIVITTSKPTPSEYFGKPIGVFVPAYNPPPKGQPHGTGTR